MHFEGKSSDEVIDEETEWKPTWQKVKTCLQKAMKSWRIKSYKSKEQQSQFYQVLPKSVLRMSPLIEPKLTWKEDILNHNDVRTNGGNKMVESSKRTGSRLTLQSMSQKR